MNPILSFGANDSKIDPRTSTSDDVAKVGPLPSFGAINMEQDFTNDLCNQRRLGICTKCCGRNAQENWMTTKIRTDEDWGYLMQKVLIDKNLMEGSSIFATLHCAYKFGIPSRAIQNKYPLKTDGSYAEFVFDFNTKYGGMIPQEVMDDAAKHKIPGYYKLKDVEPTLIARAISEGKVVLARFAVGENTYTAADGRVSWAARDLFPLRVPKVIEGGHAWVITEYSGLDENQELRGLNSWSRAWGDNGYFNFIFKTQKGYFTEAWVISDEPLPEKKVYLTKDLSLGVTDVEVKILQKFLNTHGFVIASSGPGSPGKETEYFGSLTKLAVIKYQKAHNINPSAGFCGPITRASINNQI